MQEEQQIAQRRRVTRAVVLVLEERLEDCLRLKEQIEDSHRNAAVLLGELQFNYALPPLPDFKDSRGNSFEEVGTLLELSLKELDGNGLSELDSCQAMCCSLDRWLDDREAYLRGALKKYRKMEDLLVDALIRHSQLRSGEPQLHRRCLEQIADILSAGFARQIEKERQLDFVLPCEDLDADDARELCDLVAARMSKLGYDLQVLMISQQADPALQSGEE